MNKQIEETLELFARQETTVQNKCVWACQDNSFRSYIAIKLAPEPKRIEVDIIKQLIVDNNYDHFYMQNLIETAFNEIREGE